MDQLIKDIKKKQSQIYDVRDFVDRAVCLYEYLGVHYNSQNTEEIKEMYEQLGKCLSVIEHSLNNILYES